MALFLACKIADQKTKPPFKIIARLHLFFYLSFILSRCYYQAYPPSLFFLLSFSLYFDISFFNLTISLNSRFFSLHSATHSSPPFLHYSLFFLFNCAPSFSPSVSFSPSPLSLYLSPPSSFLTCSVLPTPCPFSLSLILSPCDPVTLPGSPARLLARSPFPAPSSHPRLSLFPCFSLIRSSTSIFTILVLNYAGSSLFRNPSIVLLYI